MMTAEQLKYSILQLAMQGKLVEQRPEEGTGEELYKKIQAVKNRLIKEGKIKRQKSLADISDEEAPFDIPETWKWTHLDSSISLLSGTDLTPDKYNSIEKGIVYITGASNIENGKVIINRWTEYPKTIAHKGDLLLTCKGTVGKTAILDLDEVHIARQIMAITPIICCVDFVNYFIQFIVTDLKKKAKSMIPGIERASVLNAPFPIPPLLEQKRIVSKIEELMPFVEQYAAASTKLNTLNTTFPDMMKKSILQEAVQGKLVPQDPNDEPASVLLKKIAEEKKRLIKEGKIKKENELPPITDTEIPFDIPESWEWARLGSLITVRGGKRLPVGKQLITEKTEHVYIRVTDMKNETVDMTDLHYLTEDVYKLISSYIIKKEDIFIVIVGSTIGKAGIIPDELDGMNLTENAARLTPYFVDKRFLLKMITSDFMQAQFVDRTHQVGQPKLALFRLKEAIIPIPPLNEQKRIVERLERFEPEILSLKNNLFR